MDSPSPKQTPMTRGYCHTDIDIICDIDIQYSVKPNEIAVEYCLFCMLRPDFVWLFTKLLQQHQILKLIPLPGKGIYYRYSNTLIVQLWFPRLRNRKINRKLHKILHIHTYPVCGHGLYDTACKPWTTRTRRTSQHRQLHAQICSSPLCPLFLYKEYIFKCIFLKIAYSCD